MADEEQIPLHRRLGLRLLQFLIVLFAIVLVRNCIIVSMNSKTPELKIQQQYYEKGYETGKQKALNGRAQTQQHFQNLLLERKYQDGYRDGWDETRKENKFQQ